ncbi:hypothetical protein H4R33_005934 [Dimargaris cristalligena]|nr:hypothetical protein H4R33_005934 [Dimargaris cristalligena]
MKFLGFFVGLMATASLAAPNVPYATPNQENASTVPLASPYSEQPSSKVAAAKDKSLTMCPLIVSLDKLSALTKERKTSPTQLAQRIVDDFDRLEKDEEPLNSWSKYSEIPEENKKGFACIRQEFMSVDKARQILSAPPQRGFMGRMFDSIGNFFSFGLNQSK